MGRSKPLRHGRIGAAEGRHFRTLFELGAAGTLSDGQLLERFAGRGGDGAELAFAALVERHGPMVLRVARSVLRDEHAAHDAFQATFLILARKGSSLWVRDSIGPWLHAVAWRVASQGRVAEGRRRRSERSAARPESTPSPNDDRIELARVLDEEIARLPAAYRSAVVACHLEGLTQHDAARRLGWPVGTLQSRLDRARRRLRDRLSRRGYAPTLAVLPSTPPPIPNALILATSRLAASPPAAPSAGPAVLALIEATTKGLFMTPWKIAAATLVTAGGLVASGAYLGAARAARATDGQAAQSSGTPIEPTRETPPPPGQLKDESASKAKDVDIHGFKFPAPARLLESAGHAPKVDEPAIPPPADGPGFPVLLEFYESRSAIGRRWHGEITGLAQAGYPIKSVPVAAYDEELPLRYAIRALPTYILVDGAGAEIARHGHDSGRLDAPELARFYNEHRPKIVDPSKAASNTAEQPEPDLTAEILAKPWETPARIKLHHSSQDWGFGSGTIIDSDEQQAVILTCAHIFKLKGQRQPAPNEFRIPITVDLFDGRLAGPNHSMVGCLEKDIAAHVVDYDFDDNVALIRIRPGRKLPASKVVPDDWKPKAGMKMYAVGCSHGNDATAWDTKILDPLVTMRTAQTNREMFEIACTNPPMEGRSGGGLFTIDGYLAGVCNLADPNEKFGFYAAPVAIHRILDRNGMSAVFGKNPEAHRTANVGDTSVFPYTETPSTQPSGTQPAASGRPEPKPSLPVSDVDRRLADLERKLDRVVEALENLGVGKKPDGPIGDFGPVPRPNR